MLSSSLAAGLTVVAVSTAWIVAVVVGALILVGIVLIVSGARLLRATRTDHAALGPLEVIGDRRWLQEDPERRADDLARARPEGAEPLAAAEEAAAKPEPVAGEPVDDAPPAEAEESDMSAPDVSATVEPHEDATEERSGERRPDAGESEPVADADDDEHPDEAAGAEPPPPEPGIGETDATMPTDDPPASAAGDKQEEVAETESPTVIEKSRPDGPE